MEKIKPGKKNSKIRNQRQSNSKYRDRKLWASRIYDPLLNTEV